MKFKHIFYIIAPKIRNEKMRNFIFLALFLNAAIFFLPRGAQAESFITDEEYGAMLYKNPRGIGCDKCHGEKGQGSLIATYKEFNRTAGAYYERALNAPPINNLSLQELADGISSSRDVMPSYFLTQNEIIIIYKYIKSINQPKKKEKK